MMRLTRIAALVVASLLFVPATAQNIATLPSAATLTGPERLLGAQGSGCPTAVQPCTAVAVTPTQIATFIGGSFQPRDADLDAIAALSTTAFGRSLLTMTDAPTARGALGLGSLATQSGTFSLAYLGGQPISANLNALAVITSAADLCPYWNGSASAANFTCTAYGRALAGVGSAAAAQNYLGVSPTGGDPNYAKLSGASFTGDIYTSRSANSGVVFLGSNGQHYLFWDGAAYQMPGGLLSLSGNISAAGASITTAAGAGYLNFYVGSTNVGYVAADQASLYLASPGQTIFRSNGAQVATLSSTGSLSLAGTISATSTVNVNATSGASYYRMQFNGAQGGYLATDATLNAYIDSEGGTTYFQSRGTAVANISANGTVNATTASFTVPLPASSGGTGDAGTGWTAYTPSASCATGSLSTYTPTGRYKQIGKTVFFSLRVVIGGSGIGTCGQGITVTLPLNAANQGVAYVGAGRENSQTGKGLQAIISSGGGVVYFVNYDNSFAGGNNYDLNVSITYEVP